MEHQTKTFRDLTVWKKSMDLAMLVYILGKSLPTEERFGLVSQIQRSAVSIPSNIAEGSKRGTVKDYVQFLRISRGSAAELETQLLLMEQIYSISIQKELSLLTEVQKMLEVLIQRLLQPTTYYLIPTT